MIPEQIEELRSVKLALPSMHKSIVGQISACAIPSMTLVAFGQATLAAYVLFVTLGVIVASHLTSKRPVHASAVAVGCIPVMMLLRGLFLYNSIQIVLAVCLAGMLTSKDDRQRLQRNKPLFYFLAFSLLYWLTSFVLSGDYSSNIRVVEFALAAANVCMLAGHRSYLASSLFGVLLSAVAMSVSLLQLGGSRLGILMVSNEISVGNPIAIGVSAALGYLLTIADRGRWLLVHNHFGIRIALNIVAGAALVLSTSRGSWLVTLIGLAIILALNRSGRKTLLACVVALVFLLTIILQTDRGPAIEHYVDNAIGDDRSLDKRTTGRANQWESFPKVFDASPLWGFGPGSGKAVSLRYTKEGKPWHSLYLLIGTETGLIGLTLLGLLLATLVRRGIAHRKTCSEVVPLLSIICFMMIGVSVSGVDSISGVFLGLAFSAQDYSAMRRVRAGNLVYDKTAAAA